MRAGTIIKAPDGRLATVVYSYLDGFGIAYGEHELGADEATWPEREAMLRDPYPSATVPCVGETFEIVRTPGDAAAKEES